MARYIILYKNRPIIQTPRGARGGWGYADYLTYKSVFSPEELKEALLSLKDFLSGVEDRGPVTIRRVR